MIVVYLSPNPTKILFFFFCKRERCSHDCLQQKPPKRDIIGYNYVQCYNKQIKQYKVYCVCTYVSGISFRFLQLFCNYFYAYYLFLYLRLTKFNTYFSLIGCYKSVHIIYKIKSGIITLKMDIQIICM